MAVLDWADWVEWHQAGICKNGSSYFSGRRKQ